MTSICSGLVVQVVYALLRGSWKDFNWHDASRRPSAIAELLVYRPDALPAAQPTPSKALKAKVLKTINSL